MRYASALECQAPTALVTPPPRAITLGTTADSPFPQQSAPASKTHCEPATPTRFADHARERAEVQDFGGYGNTAEGKLIVAALIDAPNKLVDIVGGDRPRAGQRGVTVDRGYDQALVRDIQTELAARGHYRSRVDGLFGRGTRGAIVDYQTAQGLPITGEPSSELLQQLRGGE